MYHTCTQVRRGCLTSWPVSNQPVACSILRCGWVRQCYHRHAAGRLGSPGRLSSPVSRAVVNGIHWLIGLGSPSGQHVVVQRSYAGTQPQLMLSRLWYILMCSLVRAAMSLTTWSNTACRSVTLTQGSMTDVHCKAVAWTLCNCQAERHASAAAITTVRVQVVDRHGMQEAMPLRKAIVG